MARAPFVLGAMALLILAGCKLAAEDAVEGVWTVDARRSQLPVLPVPALNQQATTVLESAVLKLEPNHKFTLSMFKTVEGTWKLVGDRFELSVAPSRKPISMKVDIAHMDAFLDQDTPLGAAHIVLHKTG